MKTTVNSIRQVLTLALLGAALYGASTLPASANALSPVMQAKVDKYKQKLIEWARRPEVVKAVKDANSKGGLPDMNNVKWLDLSKEDPGVAAIMNNDASKVLKDLTANEAGISKLYLRDKEANLVAGNSDAKPLLYNNAQRPPFKMPFSKAAPWAADEIKPDPATQVEGVHVGVPVLDGGKPIGVLHSSVIAE